MSRSKHHSRATLTTVLFTAFLTVTLTLILVAPLDYLLPVLRYPSSCARQDQTHRRVFDPSHDLERDSFKSTPIQNQLSWEDLLMPDSGGGILAQQPPPDAESDAHEDTNDKDLNISYGISMFHQLHCLIILRGLIFPETSHKKVNSTLLPHSENPDMDRFHWAHCFDYIAQAIICAADDAIEQPKKTVINGRTVFNVHGVGAVHQCRDSKRLWEVSMDSAREKVDMRAWKNGVGAREFFGRGRGGG